jgi:hypothetical protein
MSTSSAFRLRILDALDRLESSGIRDLLTSEWSTLISNEVTEDNVSIFLKLVYSPRNRAIMRKLIPLLNQLPSRVPRAALIKSLPPILTRALSDERNHEVVATVWSVFISKGIVTIDSPFEALARHVGPNEHITRKGIGLIISHVSRSVMSDPQGPLFEAFSTHILNLLRVPNNDELVESIFESLTLVIRARPEFFETRVQCLLGECSDILLKRSSIKLNRALAQACCDLLLAIAESYGNLSVHPELRRDIIRSLSRDNLLLFAMTRSNPRLRDSLRVTSAVWFEKLTRTQDSPFLVLEPVQSFQSPEHNQRESSPPLISFRVADSPFKKSEACIECMSAPAEPSSQCERVELSPFVRTTEQPQLSIAEAHEPPQCLPKTYGIGDLIRLLTVEEKTERVSLILESISALSEDAHFADSIACADATLLHDRLESLRSGSKLARFLYYKFFQDCGEPVLLYNSVH